LAVKVIGRAVSELDPARLVHVVDPELQTVLLARRLDVEGASLRGS